jgi:hypothetical protein
MMNQLACVLCVYAMFITRCLVARIARCFKRHLAIRFNQKRSPLLKLPSDIHQLVFDQLLTTGDEQSATQLGLASKALAGFLPELKAKHIARKAEATERWANFFQTMVAKLPSVLAPMGRNGHWHIAFHGHNAKGKCHGHVGFGPDEPGYYWLFVGQHVYIEEFDAEDAVEFFNQWLGAHINVVEVGRVLSDFAGTVTSEFATWQEELRAGCKEMGISVKDE